MISQKKIGFTLLEVLVSFAILSTFLAVIIQSQGEMVFFLKKTDQLHKVQNVVINELLKIERMTTPVVNDKGVYPDHHPLAQAHWKLTVTEEMFMDVIPIKKITYGVDWKLDKQPQHFELSIYK